MNEPSSQHLPKPSAVATGDLIDSKKFHEDNDVKTLPYQEHNSLIATREFLLTLLDEEKLTDVPEKLRLSARSFLKHYPSRLRLDELYKGNTIADILSNSSDENPNKLLNNNQTWDTPGFKWKTEVEFISKKNV